MVTIQLWELLDGEPFKWNCEGTMLEGFLFPKQFCHWCSETDKVELCRRRAVVIDSRIRCLPAETEVEATTDREHLWTMWGGAPE